MIVPAEKLQKEFVRHAGTAASGAGLMLLLALRFGWALVPLSFWFLAHRLRPAVVEARQWPAFLLMSVLLIGWAAAAIIGRASRSAPDR